MGKMLTTIVRVLLGLSALLFGLNGFFFFMPPPELAGVAGEFIGIMAQTGYLFIIQSIVLVVTGFMFLFNKMTPFAAVLIFPFTLNWVLFHLFLDLPSILGALVMFILNIYILAVNLDKYKPMLKA